MQLAYPARLKPLDEGGVLVTFRDLPEAITDGDDRPDAVREAMDCLDTAVEGYLVEGLDLPEPSKARRGEILVPVPLPTASKAALAIAMQANDISKAELARRLGCDFKEAARLVNPRHRSRSDRMALAIAAAGGNVVLSVAAE